MTAPMSPMSPQEIRQGLFENAGAPHGSARVTRAEFLSAAAETTGEADLFRQSLQGLVDAYEYSSERTKMVVPFARLLQEYDRDPASFAAHEARSLYWRFKWVAGGIVESPDIPLASVDRWLVDMERRYRLAGYSERAVRQAEFYLADATGDTDRMERAVAGWMAAERDEMSDCHACELNTQGWYRSRRGEDAEAVRIWEPVLAGGLSCMEEPHRVLAHSLLPLVRLGRAGEARAHHLRGYRMARGNESLLRSIGEHIEFCALTGNESRGLEILAEHSAHLGPLGDVESQLEFTGGILVLLRRLRELGLVDRATVPYRGSVRTVGELYELLHADAAAITARFDARNGNALVSRRLTERIAQQPLLDALPLGVRSAALPPAPQGAPAASRTPVPKDAPAAAPDGAGGFAELVERARAARAEGRPSARALWADVARRIGAESGHPSDPALAADVLEFRAMTALHAGEPRATAMFTRAAESQRAAGQESRAAFADLAAAGSAVELGAPAEEIRALLAAAVRSAGELPATDPLRPRRTALAELTALRIEAFLTADEHAGAARRHGSENGDRAGDRAGAGADQKLDTGLVTALQDFIAARDDADPPHGTVDVIGQAELDLARALLSAGDLRTAEPLLASAAGHQIAGGRPWEACQPLSMRASVLAAMGDLAAAEASARAALGHSVELVDPEEQSSVRLTLADVLLERGDGAEEAAEHALEATHWLDQAGLAATSGARARTVLARAYAEADRTVEAVEVLHSVLPDLVAAHGEDEVVQARQLLGRLLQELNDPKAAAEQFLLGAEVTKGWEDVRAQATLANSAADALSAAGLSSEARSAYEQSLELWRRAGGHPVAEVRVLRSLAWLAVEGVDHDDEDDDEDGMDGGDGQGPVRVAAAYARAQTLMDEAFGVLRDLDAPQCRYEWAQTCQQLARLLEEELYGREEAEDDLPGPDLQERGAVRERALRLTLEAAEVFAEFGGAALRDRFQSLVRAAWTEQELGRAAEAEARLTTLIAELSEQEGAEAEELMHQAEQIRDRM
ncbi:tetratricopeptide repeat protein [Streptomyces sp. NPDC047315]|uniref:tetratricopeptide repeat protein n=1 Tax=Streptomyces sp. NPDC047315 TaxID=3155142 RepID=UPI0033CBCF8E